jgi:hypothetical protein
MRPAPRGKPDGGYGWYFAVFRIQNCGAKPFCAAGQVGLRAAVKTIFCRLSAARGHFASQNRRTPYFQKTDAAVYVEPPSGGNAALHGFG